MSWAAVAANTTALSKMTDVADASVGPVSQFEATQSAIERVVWGDAKWATVPGTAQTDAALPPHFPNPTANPIAHLEAALAEKDEIIAAQYAEMKGWRMQLETALARIAELDTK